jgi:hypothetical protein
MVKRPAQFDVCLAEYDVVYASHTPLGGFWSGGLFARVDIDKERVLCEYRGKILTKEEEKTSSSEYLMTARDPSDLRRRVVIDGDPSKYANIAGYANYSEHQNANSYFVDKTIRGGKCRILLIAKEHIPMGTEIRVDYDMGSSTHPFRDMMIRSGTYADCKQEYKTMRWEFPLM